MKTPPILVTLLLGALVPAVTWAAETVATGKKDPAESPYAPLAFLAGGVWSGDLPAGKDGPQTKIELRFARAENKQGLRFDSTFVQGSHRAPYTSGMYGWNAATGKFVIFYTDHSGSLVEGPVTREGSEFVHELTIIDAAGKVNVARVRLNRVSDDVFTNTIFLPKNGTWEKYVEVRYERHP